MSAKHILGVGRQLIRKSAMAGTEFQINLTPKQVPLYNHLIACTQNGVTANAPLAAYQFLLSEPEISDDLFLSRVIALAVQCADINNAALLHLSIPGPLSSVQLFDYFARRLEFSLCQKYSQFVIKSAQEGKLGLEELSLLSVRTLLHESGNLGNAQLAFVDRTFATNKRELFSDGEGIWLGARATVGAIGPTLKSILEQSRQHLDNVGLVLITQNGQANTGVIEVAKQFKKAVLINYETEDELVERLRAMKMKAFIEMHGMQNSASFLRSLQFGVSQHQLTWAGLPETCPVPFLDGQLLDPILSQCTDKNVRPIPLRCWLPPISTPPRLQRGKHYGVWASSSKLSQAFIENCLMIANARDCRLQIYVGKDRSKITSHFERVDFVENFEEFQPNVLLDTNPISGGASCLIALQNNIPVVTMPSETLSSRLGASILLNYGFPDGVALSSEDFRLRAYALYDAKPLPLIPKSISWELANTVENFFP
jgi:hypothetical protein